MLDINLLHQLEVLPIQERMAIMEHLARSVQKDLQVKPQRKGKSKAETAQKIEFSRGMLRRAGVPPLTDDQVEQALTDSLMEDYFKT
jgi:hypothetical protein